MLFLFVQATDLRSILTPDLVSRLQKYDKVLKSSYKFAHLYIVDLAFSIHPFPMLVATGSFPPSRRLPV